MSDPTIIEQLRVAREFAWAGLVPAFDHAIVLAQEADAQASQLCMDFQTYVSPTYPPLVLKLAESAP